MEYTIFCVYLVIFLVFYDGVADKIEPQPTDDEEIYLNPTYLTFLATTEHKIYEKLKNLRVDEENPDVKQAIRNYVHDYEESTGRSVEIIRRNGDSRNDFEIFRHITSNPIITYRMIRRIVKEFDQVYQKLDNGTQEEVENIFRNGGLDKWHEKNRHFEAMQTILRLAYFYDNTDAYQLSKGLLDFNPSVGLTLGQTLEIAQYASSREYYALAIEWLLATELRAREESDANIDLENLEQLLKNVIELHDNNFERNMEVSRLHMMKEPILCNTNCSNEKLTEILKKRTLLHDYRQKQKAAVHTDKLDIHYKFISLCNGENFQGETEKSKLMCFLDTKRNPYFTVNPVKVEILNRKPYIYQFHDVVSNELIKKIISLANAPPLFRDYGQLTPSGSTVQLTDEHPLDTAISKRIEMLTNLKVVSRKESEPLGILSAAFGGHVATHVDVYGDNSSDIQVQLYGDLVSSVVVGLDDDTHKELTVAFPILGISARATKGSIINWPNKLRNGKMDTRSLHGVCPVLLGHKWIATKFMHEHENFLRLPCELDSKL